jgi:hypothetical protein
LFPFKVPDKSFGRVSGRNSGKVVAQNSRVRTDIDPGLQDSAARVPGLPCRWGRRVLGRVSPAGQEIVAGAQESLGKLGLPGWAAQEP